MHPANQRPGKPDKITQGAHNQISYPRIQWENTLDKRGATEPQKEECRERNGSLEPESGSNNNRGECKVKSKSKKI